MWSPFALLFCTIHHYVPENFDLVQLHTLLWYQGQSDSFYSVYWCQKIETYWMCISESLFTPFQAGTQVTYSMIENNTTDIKIVSLFTGNKLCNVASRLRGKGFNLIFRDLCINRNNHQKPTFHPLGNFLNPALRFLKCTNSVALQGIPGI
jgi:hypothetical protein